MSKFLTKGKIKRRDPMECRIASLGASVMVRPLSAGEIHAIEKSFPSNADGRCADPAGFMRAIVAAAVTDEAGAAVFTPDEVRDSLDSAAFFELWDAAAVFLGLKKAEPKN